MRGFILFVIATWFAAPAVAADPLAVAREHYARANTAYDLQQYVEAAREYEEAFRLKPDPVLLFNIGQSYRNAKEYEKAIGAYRSFVRRQPASPHRAEVEARINDLRALIDEQKRQQNQPPAGPAAVELRTPEPAPPAPPPPPQTAPPPATPPARADHRRRNLEIAGAVGAVVGAGLVAGGAAFEVTRRADENALAHPDPGTPWRAGLPGDIERDRAAEIALFAVGGAALVAGTVTALLGLRHRSVTLSPVVTAGHTGVLVQLEMP